MNVSATSTNVSCYGSADGSTSVFASGGHAPYSYNWVGNNGLSLSILIFNTKLISRNIFSNCE